MYYKWYGTATLLIESENTRLLIDPYRKQFARKDRMPDDEICSADAIFITHPHVDHFKDTDSFSHGKIPVFVSETGISHAEKYGLDHSCMRRISAGDCVTVGDLTVRAYPAEHCRFDAASILRILFSPRTWLHFSDCVSLLSDARRFSIKRDDVLAFEVSDGVKNILVFGSAGMNENALYPDKVDLMFFPYQGRRRIDKVLAKFLRRMSPKKIVIDHFDDAFPPITHEVNTKRFIPTAEKYAPSAVAVIPELYTRYEV